MARGDPAPVGLSLDAVRHRFGLLLRNESLALMGLSILFGILGGYSALIFRAAAALVLRLFYAADSGTLIERAQSLPWWAIVWPPAVGGLLVGLINVRLMGGRRAQGVAHIIECSMIHGGQMPFKRGLYSALASILSVGCGASVGREGAILHLTSTLASSIGRVLRLPKHHTHTILGCGVAAAMAANFNAPIAGVFFALEVVIGHYALSAFAPVVVSSVIGTIITRIHFGDFPAYVLPHYDIVTYWEFPAFVLLGVVCGLVAISLMASIFFVQDQFARFRRLPDWLRPAIGGLAVGVIGTRLPEILSVGYETTDRALLQQLGLAMLILLPIVKTLAVSISIGSGFGGGIFSPSLFVGATLGGAFGIVAGGVFPQFGVHSGLYAIIGMAATSAAVMGAPISSILIVFELLGDFKVTIGVMSGAAVSCLVTQQLLGESYDSWQLRRRGIVIEGARAQQILREHSVAEAMALPSQIIPATMKLNDLKQFLYCLPEGAEAMVVGEGNRLVGTIGMDAIKDVAFDPLANEDAIEAQSLTRIYPTAITLDMTLDRALKVMEEWGEDQLPVVKDADGLEVAGMLRHKDLLAAYNRALLQAESESRGG